MRTDGLIPDPAGRRGHFLNPETDEVFHLGDIAEHEAEEQESQLLHRVEALEAEKTDIVSRLDHQKEGMVALVRHLEGPNADIALKGDLTAVLTRVDAQNTQIAVFTDCFEKLAATVARFEERLKQLEAAPITEAVVEGVKPNDKKSA